MKFNFKKIASILVSTVMLSSTVALAAAANFPAPFVQNGNANVAIVYGSAAAPTDYAAVLNINSALTGSLAQQTAPMASSGGTTGASSSGGDSVNLATSSQLLYQNSSINAARVTLTSTDLPNLLADGIATDLQGTQYKYTQKITPGTTSIAFSKGGQSIDPVSMLNIGTAASNPLFNYTLTFTKAINTSDTTNVVGTSSLKILGQQYVIGSSSDATNLYLYGSGSELSVDEGTSTNFTYAGKTHSLTFKGASSTTQATIVVDGVQKTVTKGTSNSYSGNFNIFVKDIFYTTKTGTLSNIDLLVGSNALHLVNGQAARSDSDDTSITGTLVTLGTTSGNLITSIQVAEAAVDTNHQTVIAGSYFTDRIFNGTVNVNFADLVPALNASSRDYVLVNTDNAMNTKVTFNTALAASAGKGPYTLNYGHNPAGSTTNAVANMNLATDGNVTIHVKEGESVNVTGSNANSGGNEYVVINSGDYGRILQLQAVGAGSSSSDKTTFKDVISGDTFDFTTGTTNTTSNTIDGQTYYVATTGSVSANITWGAGAASGNPGTQTSLFPRIKMPSGAWISFLASTAVNNRTTYALPGVDSLTTYESGTKLTIGNGTLTNTTTVGNAVWNVTQLNNGDITPLIITNGTLAGVEIGGSNCVFNVTTGPAILVQQPKTTTGSGSTNGDLICIPLGTEGSTAQPDISTTPFFSDGTTLSGLNLVSNTNQAETVDVFGTLVKTDSTNNNQVELWIPKTQMYADVLITAPSTTVTSIGGSVVGGSGSVKVLGSVAVSDSQVSQVAGKNLIVIGGSCVNTVAAQLLGSTHPLCGADFTTSSGIGSGQFLIQTFSQSGGTIATLVAGYDASDTTNAATYLTTQPVATTVGSKYTGTSGTQATLSTASSNTTA